MFVVITTEGFYYNGKAGEAWLSNTKEEAFAYTKEGAERKAAMFNRATNLHGHTFKVEAAK